MSGALVLLAVRVSAVLATALLLDRASRRWREGSRTLWVATALVLLLAPLTTFRPMGIEVAMLPSPAGPPIPPIPDAAASLSAAIASTGEDSSRSSPSETEWVTLLYLLGLGALLLRRTLQQRRIAAVVARSRPVERDAPITGRIREAAAALGIAEPPVRWSSDVALPFVAGATTPVVVLPRPVEAWSAREQRTMLLHEFAHVRHRDLRHLLAWDLLVAAYWWNPLVWCSRRAVREAMEADSDAAAARCTATVEDYVQDLVRLARRGLRARTMQGMLAFGASSRLGHRVQQLLAGLPPEGSGRRRLLVSGIAVLGLVTLLVEPVVQSATQSPEATGTMNVSDGGRDVSSNLAGVQARWSVDGAQHGLFLTGPTLDETIHGARMAPTDRALLLREVAGEMQVVELRAGQTLDLDPAMLAALRRSVPDSPGHAEGPPSRAPEASGSPARAGRGARSAQLGLPALSDDPSARVVQAGWLQSGVRYGVMVRGTWALQAEGPRSPDADAWLVVYGSDLTSGRSQWIVYRGGEALARMNNPDGSLDDAASRWGAAVFSAFRMLVERARS